MSRTIGLPSDYGHLELPESRDVSASAVIRREEAGTVAWQVLPPDGDGDAWVAVYLQGDDTVAASSWSGWLVELDVTRGTRRRVTSQSEHPHMLAIRSVTEARLFAAYDCQVPGRPTVDARMQSVRKPIR